MALERIAPDALLLQTNLTGAVSALQDDPDLETGVWLTAPALQGAGALTLYLTDAQADQGYAASTTPPPAGNNYFHGAGNLSGWNTGTTVAGRYGDLTYNTEVGRASLVATEPAGTIISAAAAGNYFRSATPLKGNFAAGNFSIQLMVRSATRAQTGDFLLKWRVWSSTDPTGVLGATQLTTGAVSSTTITASLSTTTPTTTTATWAAPAFSLNNEYLFFTCYLQTVTAGTNNNEDINLVSGTSSRVLTTSFTPSEPDTQARVSFPAPQESAQAGAGLQEFRALVRKKGAGTNPTAALRLYESGALVSSLTSQAISSTAGTVVSGTWDAAGHDPLNIEADVWGSGAVGGSLEVGAIEWNATTQAQIIASGFVDSNPQVFGSDIALAVDNTDVRVSFPTPSEVLSAGPGLQEVRALVRKKGSGSDPSVSIEVWEDGVFKATILSPQTVLSTTGTVVVAPWSASVLSNLTGVGVEVRVIGTGVVGGSLEVGAVRWNAFGYTPQILAPTLESRAQIPTHFLHGDDVTVSNPLIPTASRIYGATVVPGVIASGFIGGQMTAGAYAPGQYAPPKDRAMVFGSTVTQSEPTDDRVSVAPSGILELVGLTGVLADVVDDPDAADANWLVLS